MHIAWRHVTAREGFEVAFVRTDADETVVDGQVAACEAGAAWGVRYRIVLDEAWRTRTASVNSVSAAGSVELELETVSPGEWTANGRHVPAVSGCLDVDLEASVLTNAFPVRRLQLAVGAVAAAPAVYVRAPELAVDRLEQTYERLPADGDEERYAYSAPAFDFAAELVYDAAHILTDYPGLAVRVL